MAFVPKSWADGRGGGTQIDAAALVDLEQRLAAYTDAASLRSFRTVSNSDVTLLATDDVIEVDPSGSNLQRPETQIIDFTGATSGSFTLTYHALGGDETTAPIPFNGEEFDGGLGYTPIAFELEALPTLTGHIAGDVASARQWRVYFSDVPEGDDVPLLTADDTLLDVPVTITEEFPGVPALIYSILVPSDDDLDLPNGFEVEISNVGGPNPDTDLAAAPLPIVLGDGVHFLGSESGVTGPGELGAEIARTQGIRLRKRAPNEWIAINGGDWYDPND